MRVGAASDPRAQDACTCQAARRLVTLLSPSLSHTHLSCRLVNRSAFAHLRALAVVGVRHSHESLFQRGRDVLDAGRGRRGVERLVLLKGETATPRTKRFALGGAQ
eukprot:594311-Pleurochrysis_carterae.AAC.1